MKKVLVALMIGNIGMANAQSLDDIKNTMMLQQFGKKNNQELKDNIDKALTKEKIAAKAEAYILKATIYSNLAQDSLFLAQADDNRSLAYAAYRQYLDKDAKKEFIKDPTYTNTPVNIYSGYFGKGIKEYNKKDWQNAANSFDTTIQLSDFIIANKIVALDFDTTAVTLAASANQNAKRDEVAAKYYQRLADKKIAGEDNVGAYQFLTLHAFEKNNMAEFEKYKALGAELYPKAEFFTYKDEDFILDMKDETEKEKRINAKIAANPNDATLMSTYGLLLFNKLNTDSSNALANYDELEQKMVSTLTKSSEVDPKTAARGYFYLGNHFINKTVRINRQLDSAREEIRNFNKTAKADKTGKLPPVPKELTTKRLAFTKAYDEETEKGLPYLVKAAEAYGKQNNTGIEKQNYKKLVDQLIIIYGEKKGSALQPADKAKFAAEETKYTNLYGTIK